MSGGAIAIMIGIDGGPYSWCIPAVVWGGFLILTAATRYVSLGSCWAGFSFPFVSWFVYRDTLILLLSILVGGLILWKHRGNIARLLHGTESKFSFHRKKPAADPSEPMKALPEPAREGAATERTKGSQAVPKAAPEEPSPEAEQGDKA